MSTTSPVLWVVQVDRGANTASIWVDDMTTAYLSDSPHTANLTNRSLGIFYLLDADGSANSHYHGTASNQGAVMSDVRLYPHLLSQAEREAI